MLFGLRLALFLLCWLASAHASPALWGGLKPGSFGVGFRSDFEWDASRGRPILAAVWYPSVGACSPMRYGDYLLIPHSEELASFAARLGALSKSAAAELIFGERTAVHRLAPLLGSQTAACRNAEPARGRHPLVLYHAGAGGSFDENAVLFEYLASHGYIVMSSAYQNTTEDVANNIAEEGRSERDFGVLLQFARTLPNVDGTKLYGVGHSYGGQTLLQWIGTPASPLTAIVSLDSTLEYTPENFGGHRPFRRSLERLKKPTIRVMLSASAEKRPRFSTFDQYLAKADRVELTVPHLKHDDYTSYAAVRSMFAGAKPHHPRMRDSYEALCRAVLVFLRAHRRALARRR